MDEKSKAQRQRENKRIGQALKSASADGHFGMLAGVVWFWVEARVFGVGVCFCDNDRPDWLCCHSRSLSSTQPPVHSNQSCPCPTVWPPQAGWRMTRRWQKWKREGGENARLGWDGIENSKSFPAWSDGEQSCVWIRSDRSASPHQCVGWLSTNVLHCPLSFVMWLVSHSFVSQCFHHFTNSVY